MFCHPERSEGSAVSRHRPISATASRIAATTPSICFGVPTVTRTHPSAPRIRRRVPHQDAASPHRSHKCLAIRPDAHQNKIRLARPIAQPQFVEQSLQSLALPLHLRDMFADKSPVRERFFKTSHRHRIHVEGQTQPPQILDLLRRARQHAQSNPRQPVRFRKRPSHEQIRMVPEIP